MYRECRRESATMLSGKEKNKNPEDPLSIKTSVGSKIPWINKSNCT